MILSMTYKICAHLKCQGSCRGTERSYWEDVASLVAQERRVRMGSDRCFQKHTSDPLVWLFFFFYMLFPGLQGQASGICMLCLDMAMTASSSFPGCNLCVTYGGTVEDQPRSSSLSHLIPCSFPRCFSSQTTRAMMLFPGLSPALTLLQLPLPL